MKLRAGWWTKCPTCKAWRRDRRRVGRDPRPGLGTVVTNERVFPIEDVYFAEGEVMIQFTVPPFEAWETGNGIYTVFAPDGSLVATGRHRLDGSLKDGPCSWRVTLGWRVTDGLLDGAREFFDHGE